MRCRKEVRWPLTALLLAVPGATSPSSLAAQAPPAVASADWTVGRDAFAELWYDALARVTPVTPAPIALYASGYAGERVAMRRARGIASRLDAAEPSLRDAMRAEGELDVLHFVPLYFVGEPPAAVLRALRAAFTATRPSPGDALAERAALIAGTVTRPAARAAALQLVDAASDEWGAVQRAGGPAPDPDGGALGALRERWLASFEPALRPYLAGVSIRRGRIVVVPALGLDGRIMQGPDGAALVMVGTGGAGAPATAPLLLAVRELAFPLIQRIPARLFAPGPGAGTPMEWTRGAAAVRAGALLLEARAPAGLPAYRALFAGAPGRDDPRTFDTRYAASAELHAALQSEVARLGGPRGAAR